MNDKKLVLLVSDFIPCHRFVVRLKKSKLDYETVNLNQFLREYNHYKQTLCLIPDLLMDIVDINLSDHLDHNLYSFIVISGKLCNYNTNYKDVTTLHIVDTIDENYSEDSIKKIVSKHLKN